MENKETRDYTGAIFLVLLGTLFLLNTTNVVPWSIWLYLLRFWPILLILAGLKMVLPKTPLGNIIMTVVYTIFMISAGVLAYFFAMEKKVPLISEQISQILSGDYVINKETQTNEQYILGEDFSGIEEKTVDIEVGASQLILEDKDENYYLFSKTTYQYEQDIPNIESESSNGNLTIMFDNNNVRRFGNWRFVSPIYELILGQTTIPTTLAITIGAGDANLDIQTTQLKTIMAKVGAGNLTMGLSQISTPESINLEIGAGEMTLSIPQNIGLSVVYDLGVGEINIGDEKIEGIGQDGTYKTTGYENATKQLTIEANVGVGTLTIERI